MGAAGRTVRDDWQEYSSSRTLVKIGRSSRSPTRVSGRGRPVDWIGKCNYSGYMASTELKVARIGNSRGVRLPAATLRRYGIGAAVVMEERSDGILLRPTGPAVAKLSWAETALAMAAAAESWGDLDVANADGLDEIPWKPRATGRRAKAPGRKPAGANGRKRP